MKQKLQKILNFTTFTKDCILKKMLRQNYGRLPTRLRFLIIILLVLGIFFRFVNLGRKVYWCDETISSLRVSGYTESELVKQVFNGDEIRVEELQKYQSFNPKKGLIDTINSLAIEDAQHSPLYYVILRLWMKWFGNSVAVTRSLSAFISLLVFPCIYWLCLELFESPLTAWVAIALIAVSPFHVLFAQEAREYSLWTVTILLSSASLLRAMRLQTKLSWSVYAATVALALYSFLFSMFVTIGHGIYVVASERFRLTKIVNAYLLASLLGLLTFAPWLVIVINNLTLVQERMNWAANAKVTPLSLIKRWTENITIIFFDLTRGVPYLTPLILIIVVYSLYFIYSKTSNRIWLFILTLVGITALALILPDLVFGGTRSTIARYLIPCYLGIQLAVAHLLATQIASASLSQRKIWQVLMAVLISLGILSCAISSQADNWWNKGLSNGNPQVARIINQTTHPLLISNAYEASGCNVVSLSHLLDPKVRLELAILPNLPQIPSGFSDVFLFGEGSYFETLRYRLEKEKNYKAKYVFHRLWRLEE